MSEWTNGTYVLANNGAKFIRQCQVIVGKDGNGDVSPATGLLIEGLRIQFEIQKTVYRTPNQALIKIFNLTQEHEKQIDKEFNDIILNAGYKGLPGDSQTMRLGFRGNIRFTHFHRDGNDHIAEINAGDGDKDFGGTLVNFTLAAGHSDEQTFAQLLTSMRATTQGHVHGKHLARQRIRGKAYSGQARDVLDKIARENDAHWSIQDGKLVMVPVDSVLPGAAIAIDSETGLLGAPEINDKGITIKTMMDLRIVPNGKLWLKNNEVKMAHLKAAKTGQKRKLNGPATPIRLDPDGVYKVYSVKHVGDTYGTDWYSECKCVALDSPIPKATGMNSSSTPDGDVL